MQKHIFIRSTKLALLLLKEQFKEPTAILWTIISPSLLFYLINHANNPEKNPDFNYMEGSSWFYGYIAASVGLFGFALYIVGRRESGFIRSFIYTSTSKIIFLAGQFLSYSVIAMIYCCTFYLLTKMFFGKLQASELFDIVVRFYACFLIFCTIGLILTLLPINFQNSSTIFSILLFTMIALGVASSGTTPENTFPLADQINLLNPLHLANKIMRSGIQENIETLVISMTTLTITLLFSMRHLRINPVWSRY